MSFSLASALGVLIGGFAVDKWNFRKLIMINLVVLSISSLILQFYDSFILILLQRIILGFSFGFLIIIFEVLITKLVESKHRGKFLFGFLNVSIIGSIIYLIFRYFFLVKTGDYNLSYAQYQTPYIFIPLLILLVIRYLPILQNTESNIHYPIKHLFSPNQRIIIIVMIILAMLTSFANTNLYIYVSSQITFDEDKEILYLIPKILGTLAMILGVLTIDLIGRKGLIKYGLIALICSATANIVISLVTDKPLLIFGFLNLYYFLYLYTIATTSVIIILEYLPNQIRGRGMVLFSLICWLPYGLSNVINMTYIFDSKLNIMISSLIILTTLVISFILIRKYLIETKGLSLDDIRLKLNLNKNVA
jgi:MFS family permease